jgi:hypothetical protein
VREGPSPASCVHVPAAGPRRPVRGRRAFRRADPGEASGGAAGGAYAKRRAVGSGRGTAMSPPGSLLMARSRVLPTAIAS